LGDLLAAQAGGTAAACGGGIGREGFPMGAEEGTQKVSLFFLTDHGGGVYTRING
jgi:hypothetical protein